MTGSGPSRLASWIAMVLDCACVGVVIGALEVAVISVHAPLRAHELPLLALLTIGLLIMACVTAGLPILMLGRTLPRHPWLRGVVGGWRGSAAGRVEAITKIAIAVVAVAAIWGVGYVAVKRVHGMYRHPGGAGLLASTLIVVGGAVIVTVAAAVVGPAARRAGRVAVLADLTRGWAGRLVAGGGVLVLLTGVDRAITSVAPAWSPGLAYEVSATVLALLVASSLGPARRYLRRRTAIAGAVVIALVAAALIGVGRAERVRGAIAGNGLLANEALSALWRISDDDGDSYSDRFGGADCDDQDAAVHPAARELPGNGRDDNCLLGDAPVRSTPVAPAPATHTGARHDILLITIDTVRADHVSGYGYARPTTPTLDALAARATRFAAAHTANPWTRFALPALLFGRYPATLPFDTTGREPRLDSHALPTLATVLRDAGYLTAASLPPSWQQLEHAYTGFDATFGVIDGPQVADAALAWLRDRPRDRPYLLWLHFADPHYPYEPASRPFGDDEVARYDAEIAAADHEIARVLAEVSADRTIVAVTSDHGEAFGERGVRFHNRNLYEEQTRVPLVIAVPAGARRVVVAPVSLVDLAPTLLALVGLAAPPAMQGVSLAPAVNEGAAPGHPVLTELAATGSRRRNLIALHHGGHVIIRDNVASTEEVYDLAADPDQGQNLGDSSVASELRARLYAAIERVLAR
jgi:choline-sulfatase